MSFKFPKTIAACRRTEVSMWEIADALLEEAGPPPSVRDDSRVTMQEVVDELEEAGLDTALFSTGWLGMLRATAFNFPPSKRRARISFSVHRIVKSPEMLEKIVAHLEMGKKLTSHYVERVMQHQRQKVERQHQVELERHREEKEAAQKAVRAAEDRKRKARTQADREAALREVKAARDHSRNIPTPPPRPNYDAIEPPSKHDVMIVDLGIMGHTHQAIGLGKQVLTAVNERIDDFGMDKVTMDAFVELALQAANVWREVANTARKLSVDKRGHIHLAAAK